MCVGSSADSERRLAMAEAPGSIPGRRSSLQWYPNGCVAQWQSGGLISLRLLVRIQPFTHHRLAIRGQMFKESYRPCNRALEIANVLWLPSSNGKDARPSTGE